MDYMNRTQHLTGREEDPFATPKVEDVKEEESVDKPDDKPEVEPEVEEKKEDTEAEKAELDEAGKQFLSSFDRVLQHETGVDFKGIVEVLTELLQFRNDIAAMALEPEEKEEESSTLPTPKVPQAVQRSKGRSTSNPGGARNYDFTRREIQAMSTQEYESKADAITAAYLNGRVLMN